MDEKRAQTFVHNLFRLASPWTLKKLTWAPHGRLEALSTFIKSQKALLARTQSDIERLNTLRNEVASTPAETCTLDGFSNQVSMLDKVLGLGGH